MNQLELSTAHEQARTRGLETVRIRGTCGDGVTTCQTSIIVGTGGFFWHDRIPGLEVPVAPEEVASFITDLENRG